MAFKTGKAFKFEIDIDQLIDTPLGTPEWEDMCSNNVDSSFNETIDTFFRLCDEGYAQNVLTGIDLQFDLTVKGESTNTALNSILGIRYDIDKRNENVFIRITDNFTSEIITITGVFTAITDPREIGTAIEFALTFKSKGKPTISA